MFVLCRRAFKCNSTFTKNGICSMHIAHQHVQFPILILMWHNHQEIFSINISKLVLKEESTRTFELPNPLNGEDYFHRINILFLDKKNAK